MSNRQAIEDRAENARSEQARSEQARSEHARLTALAGHDLTELTGDPDLEAAVRLATRICAAPMGAVNIITDREQRQLAAVGMPVADCAREDSMCAVTIAEPKTVAGTETVAGTMTVPDATKDARFAHSPFVTGRLGRVRFYAASPLRAPDGPVLGTLCVFDTRVRTLAPEDRNRLDDLARLVVDVLELHRRTRLLAGALRAVRVTGHELERSSTALARFTDQIGHDLQKPLNGVRGLLERVIESPSLRTDAEALRCATEARASTGRMSAMVETVLERAAAGGGRPEIGPVDLGAIVGEILDDLESEIRAARARVMVGRLPTVAGDGTQLRAVMQKLIGNALRHRHPRRLCKVQIAGERVGTGWVVRVVDNGVGIPLEHRYEALQLVGGRGDRPAEHGIGLATCRRIIEAHHGDMSLEDTPGGGTTVIFHLPLPEPPVPAAGQAARPATASRPATAPPGQPRPTGAGARPGRRSGRHSTESSQ